MAIIIYVLSTDKNAIDKRSTTEIISRKFVVQEN